MPALLERPPISRRLRVASARRLLLRISHHGGACSGHPQLLSLPWPQPWLQPKCHRRAVTVAPPGCFLPVPLEKGRRGGLGTPAPSACSVRCRPICAPRIVCSLLLAAGNCRRCLPSLPLPDYSPSRADLDSRWTGTSFPPRSFGGRWRGQEPGPALPENSQPSSPGSVHSFQEPGCSRRDSGEQWQRVEEEGEWGPGLRTHTSPTPLGCSHLWPSWIAPDGSFIPAGISPSSLCSFKNHSNLTFDVSQSGSRPPSTSDPFPFHLSPSCICCHGHPLLPCVHPLPTLRSPPAQHCAPGQACTELCQRKPWIPESQDPASSLGHGCGCHPGRELLDLGRQEGGEASAVAWIKPNAGTGSCEGLAASPAPGWASPRPCPGLGGDSLIPQQFPRCWSTQSPSSGLSLGTLPCHRVLESQSALGWKGP